MSTSKKRVRTYKIGTCSAAGCGEHPLIARGLCCAHYARLKKYGTTDKIHPKLGTVVLDGNKYCTQCCLELPMAAFRHSSSGRIADYCRPCETSYFGKRKAEKLKKGECLSCGRQSLPGLRYCDACRRRSAQYVSNFSRRATIMINSARDRAEKQRVICTIDKEWVMAKLAGRCDLTGIPFDLEGKKNYVFQRFNPYSPSIDRKIAGGDYSPENCRMVLTALNIGINHWGEDIYRAIAKAYLRNRREKRKQRHSPGIQMQNYDLALEGQRAQSVRIRKH